MKSVAIMQPYFFPYLGYFQLMSSCDTFVFLDNVNYINRGWVNRNQFILSGLPFLFSVPLDGASQNKLINELYISDGRWVKIFFKSIAMNYCRSKCYDMIIESLRDIIGDGTGSISEFNQRTLIWSANQLGIETEYKIGSVDYSDIYVTGQDRIISICKKEMASRYINAIGGLELYDNDSFNYLGIELSFVRPLFNPYEQNSSQFHPGMSIIDLLMNNDQQERQLLLENYELT
jgi:hypothetical protein